jgi:hypothetical protein
MAWFPDKDKAQAKLLYIYWQGEALLSLRKVEVVGHKHSVSSLVTNFSYTKWHCVFFHTL